MLCIAFFVLLHFRFSSDQYSAVSKMDILTLDVIKEHLGCVPSPLTSSLSLSQASQEMLTSEPEDMEGSQLINSDNPATPGSVTLEEDSQKILCHEVYRAPTDQLMDTNAHSQKHLDKPKQKKSQNTDSPRQPLRQINNTMQVGGRSPGPSKLSLSSRDQRTRASKFNDWDFCYISFVKWLICQSCISTEWHTFVNTVELCAMQ